MRKLLFLFFIMLMFVNCSDDYDDSSAWKDIDQLYNNLDQLNEQIGVLQTQVEALSQIVGGGAITSITESPNGGYIVSYKGSDNIEHNFVIATIDQMVDQPIIGVQKDGNTYYWTTTVKGTTSFLLDANKQKIPVSGSTPQIKIDTKGYWTINGTQILDSNQRPIKAEGKEMSLITEVVVNPNGTATLTIGNGEEVTVSVFNLFNIQFTLNGESVTSPFEVEEGVASISLDYTIVGTKADQALMLITSTKDLTAGINTDQKKLTVTLPTQFDEGNVMLMLFDTEENVLIKPLVFSLPPIENGGISTAADFVNFVNAVTDGSSLRKFKNKSGEIVLLQDIDMTGQTLTSGAGENILSNTTTANQGVTYTMGNNTFDDTFDGQNFQISNLTLKYNLEDGNIAHGLFNALGANGVIKNLRVAGEAIAEGNAPQGAAIGGLVGYSTGTILACTSKINIAFKGTDNTNISVRMGGLVGVLNSGQIGDNTPTNGCVNEGVLTCGSITNTGAGANSAFHQGGVAGYLMGDGVAISHSINKGAISAPSGRGGGLVGTMVKGNLNNCTNEGLVQDDINNIFASNSKRYNVKRMGGLVGGTSSGCSINNSTNAGNVFSQNGSRTGGFVGHNDGNIVSCTNKGTILSDATADGNNKHGAGWAAGYSGASTDLITDCHIGGKVGDYSIYKNNVDQTPNSLYSNAVRHGGFSAEKNNFSNQDEAYYDWNVLEEKNLSSGVIYKHYSFTNFKQNIYAIEVDLTNPNVTFETVMANEISPNPNGNNNSNNGKVLRETLSETANRRRSEGRNIITGINTGFFNSNDGFPRGMHIEEGEPVFVNNPYVRNALTNHRPGFTFFEDRSLSFDNRSFTGKIKVEGKEYEYYSVNDTIVRLNDNPIVYDANLYTSRFVKTPHPGINNPIGEKALFIVGRNSNSLKVNYGYLDATITQIVDGRTAPITVPFITDKTDWVLQVTGEKAAELAQKIQIGSQVQIMAELKIGSSTNKIKVHNSSMFRYLHNGVYSAPPKAEDAATIYQTMNVGMTQDGKKVILFCVDGKTENDRGLDFYEAYRVASKMGLYNTIRFDGGGSTTMWTYSDGTGKVVNTVSDKQGERSCMNYLHVRVLD